MNNNRIFLIEFLLIIELFYLKINNDLYHISENILLIKEQKINY
jgi:hypothetical protein